MGFEYVWKNNEANFGPPLERQVEGGAHVTFEILLKKGGKYIALRRRSIPGHESPPGSDKHPGGMLFFCHNLICYGESVEKCVKRIVREQAGVGVKNFRAVYIYSAVQKKDNNWSICPHVIAEVGELPRKGMHGNEVTEVVAFDKNNVPKDFAWWKKKELADFLMEFDRDKK